uniref:Uncharacterized protein n=1 Tax=Anopheles minimus TaxID=112268 RepID=A0A182WP25_9DIPT
GCDHRTVSRCTVILFTISQPDTRYLNLTANRVAFGRAVLRLSERDKNSVQVI